MRCLKVRVADFIDVSLSFLFNWLVFIVSVGPLSPTSYPSHVSSLCHGVYTTTRNLWIFLNLFHQKKFEYELS